MTELPAPSQPIVHRDGLWIVEYWVRFLGFTLQTRMVIIARPGGLLLYSPGPANPGDTTLDALRALGEPRWLVAPNEIHNVGLPVFHEAFPDAHITGCAGHPSRVPTLHFDALLDAASPPGTVPWTEGGDLRFHVIGGNCFLREIALFHEPTRTLVLTDAVELMDPEHVAGAAPGRFMGWLFARTGLRMGEPCMSPEHNLYNVDPEALAASYAEIDSWPFESMIIAHGRVLEGQDARDAFRRAFESNLARVRSRGRIVRGLWAWMSRFQ